MSRKLLDLARVRALAVSTASVGEPLGRAAADSLIRLSVRNHGGVGGCEAALAQHYGDHPELAAPRVRWARLNVAALYQTAGPHRAGAPVRRRAAGPFRTRCAGNHRSTDGVPGDWPIDQLIAI